MTLIDVKSRLRQLISDHCGLSFRTFDEKNLSEAISSRMKDLDIRTEFDYLTLVTASESTELEALLNSLTINHTYFFRNKTHFEALKNYVLPHIYEHNCKHKSLRIWSCACSTGEEPYSIAMLLAEQSQFKQWNISIFATDIDSSAIDLAQKGVFSSRSMKEIPQYYLDKYFCKKVHGDFVISEEIRDQVSFNTFNLVTEHFPSGFDLILCRNVLIYFDTITVNEITTKFHSSLNDNGFLFLGFSEFMSTSKRLYHSLHNSDAIFYQKKNEIGKSNGHQSDNEKTLCYNSSLNTEINHENDSSPQDKKNWIRNEPHLLQHHREHEKESLNALERIQHHITQKNYGEALASIENLLLEKPNEVKLVYCKAEIALARDNTKETKRLLDTVMEIDPLWEPAYTLLGMVHLKENGLSEAELFFRKALYLNEKSIMARFHLATIIQQRGDNEKALLEYRNIIKVLSKMKLDDTIPYSDTFQVSSLLTICKTNVERILS